ncbi:MAG: MBL fold metallo-hydrolase [Pseudonocardiaceae bacterium]
MSHSRRTFTLYAGNIRAELRYVGAAAHTTNDVLVWLPEQSILFAGDLVFNGGTPFVVMGSVAGSRAALNRIRELRPHTIVPGHGEVCGPEKLDLIDDYLSFVQQSAAHGTAAGLTPLQLAQGLDLGKFTALSDSERLVANLHRAYAELATWLRSTVASASDVSPEHQVPARHHDDGARSAR